MSSAASPRFWAGPIRYCRWASREKPAYFWSVVLGALGPIQLAVVPPVRNFIGDYNAPPIPVTYPGESRENENTAKPIGLASLPLRGEHGKETDAMLTTLDVTQFPQDLESS
ncbi:NADH-ubiquinone oxidoreductase 9.5 kDa subunit [Colletotrichum paranaense]|uniref:NADH-ubiquinone oxidoreductase 9.5 kDa subunit n=1 Tax=Colletotrichum paranaense TaxID=1914294 RepID=A0ABQ9SDG8_9PEZI|nr:NADH-ubiquinone oxidoreductase 9.5 kDa subunit [Colletotrichum paranaense]KAK1533549.1 NADH-ubiquinone oxidoreductase 9.5 kDa subunit [Colletotrichum paranaense]